MRRIILLIFYTFYLGFSNGMDRFEFKENIVLPRIDSFNYSLLGNSKIDSVLGLELGRDIYLMSNGSIKVDIYGISSRKLNKKIKIFVDGNYTYIEGNKITVETKKKVEEREINLNSMKYDNLKIERKGKKLELSVFPIVYETIEKLDDNTYKFSSYMKKSFIIKKVGEKVIQIYYDDKLEKTIKLEEIGLMIYGKNGELEGTIEELDDRIKITEGRKMKELVISTGKLEIYNDKNKKIMEYTITER